MGPPLQDFLCAFELSDWVFPVAHSANCCVPPTSESHLARRTLSLCWPLNQHPALLGREDCTLVAWYRFLYAPRTGGRMTVTIGRRKLLAALGGAVAAWPLAARAQQAAVPVIGLVNAGSREASASRVAAFRKGLSETGYVEGQNVAVEYHWLGGEYDRLPTLMADLVGRRVAVIATPGSTVAA